jgi:hypothetical protein
LQDVIVDFYETMGAHVGVDMTNSSDWLFSEDSFATPIAPYTGFKGPAALARGTTRDPSIYIYEWDPIPMTIRSITADMEVIID